MSEHITASPLTWPDGWKRTSEPATSQFGNHSIAKATNFVIEELGRMGVPDWMIIISSNLKLKRDGIPYSTQREPDEYGGQPKWEGWSVAVGAFDHTPEELALAKLLDKRNEINREAGQLKRNMCAYGRGLIASTGTTHI